VTTLASTFILVDYENVQPDADTLQVINKQKLKIFIFAKRKDKLSFDRAKILQPLGNKVEYILTKATGNNALDFHIAFQLGVLAQKSPGSQVYVVSKDTGYDSLISFVNETKRLNIKRHANLVNIPGIKIERAKEAVLEQEITAETLALDTLEYKMNKAKKNLSKSGNARPRTVSTLIRSLNVMFNHGITEQETQAILEEMQREGFINVAEDGKVTYILNIC
jgi:hypothetical protein